MLRTLKLVLQGIERSLEDSSSSSELRVNPAVDRSPNPTSMQPTVSVAESVRSDDYLSVHRKNCYSNASYGGKRRPN